MARPDTLIDLGRINVRNGVALGYNPTDYFRAGAVRAAVSVSPASLKENRQGSVMLRGQPAGMPDGIHLHSLIYRRVMRWAVGNRSAKALTRRNSMTSPYLWLLCMTAVVPAMLFWDSTALLGCFIVLFGLSYTALYWRIVRFKSPRWMVTKR